jgi:protein-S-isoprenylcysteine O-methyltransferase Ste14
MISLYLRNLFFTILQPGVVAGLVPYLLIRVDEKEKILQSFQILQYTGIFLFVIGFLIMMNCILNFAIHGKGTLSPADPTKQLVIAGLYKYSRNPMYVGVILMLIGEAFFFQSGRLCIYSILIFLVFHLFIVFFEEPRLKKDFGAEYDQFCNKVRRWV